MKNNQPNAINASIKAFVQRFSNMLEWYIEHSNDTVPSELLSEANWSRWTLELNEQKDLEQHRFHMEPSVLHFAERLLKKKTLDREEMTVAFYLCRYGKSIVPRHTWSRFVKLRKHLREQDKMHLYELKKPTQRLDARVCSAWKTVRLWLS